MRNAPGSVLGSSSSFAVTQATGLRSAMSMEILFGRMRSISARSTCGSAIRPLRAAERLIGENVLALLDVGRLEDLLARERAVRVDCHLGEVVIRVLPEETPERLAPAINRCRRPRRKKGRAS